MQSPYSTPPIPTPDEMLAPSTPLVGPRDWKDAPQIVKSANLLALLGIIVIPLLLTLVINGLMTNFIPTDNSEEFVKMGLLLFVTWVTVLWLRSGLRKGLRIAWTVQIVLSLFGLTSFPIGTVIYAYLLSQWFKPETKAWFGVQ